MKIHISGTILHLRNIGDYFTLKFKLVAKNIKTKANSMKNSTIANIQKSRVRNGNPYL